MHKRNQITLILSTIILSSAIIAGVITVKDSSTIVSDFQNFIDDPFTWEPPQIEDEGNLHLYITSDMYENESATIPLDGIKLTPPAYEIYHIYLTINKIMIEQQGTETLIDLVEDPIIIDLKALNHTIDLFDAFVIPEGLYSSMHFFYETEIIADTDIGNKTFNSGENDFFNVAFVNNRNNNTQTDLQINKNEETELLLTLQMQIKWQQEIMFPHLFGYLDFTIPV